VTRKPLSSSKGQGQLAGGRDILWRPPTQLVISVVTDNGKSEINEVKVDRKEDNKNEGEERKKGIGNIG